MKTLFIFRDSFDAKFILSQANANGLVGQIILESGKDAKKRKLLRMFKKSKIYRYPERILDLLFLQLFVQHTEHGVKKILGKYEYPKGKIILHVTDSNEDKCIRMISECKPELICIFGTAILTSKFLKQVSIPIINIHTGILPHYRNVHSDFWALHNKDFANIGVSIIRVDAGVDTGDIVLMKRITYRPGDSLIDVKVKILQMIPKMVEEVLEGFKRNRIRGVKQLHTRAGVYTTPGWRDLVGLIINHL
jgi:folate-dependent phosphoribosylglycinamide formyltransferase PurN